MSFGYNVAQVRILSLILVQEAGFAEPLMLRPFGAQVDHGAVTDLLPSSGEMTASEVASTVGAYIRPNMQSGAIALIPNGWNTPRYRYTLQVECINNMGLATLCMVSGYSDYADPSLGGTLDPNLPFRINDIAEIRSAAGMSPHSPVPLSVVDTNLSLMRTPADAGFGTGQQFLQRPVDVFEVGPNAVMASNSDGLAGLSSTCLHPLGVHANVDSRLHSTSSRYAYDLLTAANRSQVVGIDESEDYVNREITSLLKPKSPLRNAFLSALNSKLNDYAGANIGTWTFSDLMTLDPTVGQRTNILQNNNPLHFGTQSDYSAMAQVAAMYAQAVPAYLSSHAMQACEFVQYVGGQTDLIGYKSVIMDRPMDMLLMAFRTVLERELYMAASFAGTMPFSIHCKCHLYGDVVITITDTTGRQHFYNYPCYAGSTYAPQITADANAYIHMASTMAELVETVRSNSTASSLY